VTGRVELLAFASGREAFIVRHHGQLFLTTHEGLPQAWATDCLGFGERGGDGEGRCVFTHGDGDAVYVELATVGLASGQRVRGKIVGGTGKYSGITGGFESPGWRYSASVSEEGVVQAFLDDLTGTWSAP
jgi:hypothetical protein